MPASRIDSQIYAGLLADQEVLALFSDSADVRAMLLVEGALAEAQGALGLIPAESAAAISRASKEALIDAGSLSKATAANAVVVPALVAAFRDTVPGSHGAYVHWGATSQDIMETGQVLRLRRVLEIFERRMLAVLEGLAALAETHADLPMAARTYGQIATPTSFGAVAAGWGRDILGMLQELPALRAASLAVSLSGAAGTLSAMDDKGPDVRAQMARLLELSDPGASWHAERGRMTALAAWATRLSAALAKMGEDLTLMTQTGIGEVTLPGSGASSTMPQKTNPVMPSVLVALGHHAVALNSALQAAGIHRQQRDGAAWIGEWLALPGLFCATGRALEIGVELAEGVAPNPEAMAQGLDDGLGLIYAEALSFALARQMPRPDAQAKVKALCAEARASGKPLKTLTEKEFSKFEPLFDPMSQLGTAPNDARAFATLVNELRGLDGSSI